MLMHIARRLVVLHAAGWVHRDLKPGNVLRRPQLHSWALIDFGCTARKGAHPSVRHVCTAACVTVRVR